MLTLCVISAGLLRAASVSLMRVPRADALRDAADGIRGAHRAADLLERRDSIIPAANVAHLALVVAAGAVGTWLVVRSVTGVPVAVLLSGAAVVVLLMADLIPRAVGRRRSLRLGYRLAWLVGAAMVAGAFATDIVVDEEDDDEAEDPVEEQRERKLIGAVLEFGETVVREVMVPRTDIVSLERSASVREAIATFESHGYSRLPVVGQGLDDVIGLVILKDLLPLIVAGRHDESVDRFTRTVQFVPETLPAPDLLRAMQASHSHLAMVVDEFGGNAGLVTIEDLLEELVGEIADEFDDEDLLVEERDDGTLVVDGRLAVSELSEILGVELPDEEWDTVAGFVLGLAGRVPEELERFDAGPIALTVARVQGRRVGEVLVERLPYSAAMERRT